MVGLVKAKGITGVSKSRVNRLCGEADERGDAFPGRLFEGERPHPWLDPTHMKVCREVRGIAVQPGEAEVS